MEMFWGSKVFIILFKVEISSFKIFGKEWMLKISIFWASLWTKITAFLNCSSSPKVEWFWGHQLMQISWIGSNSCQLPSDRANLSSVSWYLRCSDSDKIDTIKRIKHNNINLKSHVDVQDCLYQISRSMTAMAALSYSHSMDAGDVFLSPKSNVRRLSFSRQRQQAFCLAVNKNQQRRQLASFPSYHR